VICQACGRDNPEGNRFCGGCGGPLANQCPKCGAENPHDHRFCGKCGSALGPAAQAASTKKSDRPQTHIAQTPAPENLEGERKTVTALFADIKGSTELEQDLDPEEARAIIDPALRLMIDAVQRYDGYVVQSTGDGIFALFGAPVAHEDHPLRALHAALRMHDEIRRYADKLRVDGRSPLQIRIGADTGEVVVRIIETGGKTEYTPIGHAANLASRMQSLANPGSTMISESTRKLVEGYFTLKPMGASRVKGIAEPINVYEVTGLGPLRTRLQRAASRGYSQFVGREREMEAMAHAAVLAYQGHGQIVAAVAEAGTGKSRLFFEFKAKNQSGWMVLEAFSVSHGKASAYLPVLDLLHSYFKISADDDARARREKVTGRLLALDRSLENAMPYLFALLGIVDGEDPVAQMDAQVKKRRTLDAIKRIVLRESLNQPLIVMFEDLHWIDEQTQGFLNLLADSIANAKVLLLVNYRPQYSHQWNSKTYYTQLRLESLGKESAAEILSARIGKSPELAPLKRLVLERSEGNPLFMEELVEALFEEGVLVRNGGVKVAKSLSQLKIPHTVQGILSARIDRLRSEEKELLQTLAVIGMEFPLALVRQVVQLPDDQLDHMLSNLQAAEFIYEQPASGDVEYRFKHALTREVAYGSMLSERRKELHGRIGVAIERLYGARIEDQIPALAHHFRNAADSTKAIHYLRSAGRQDVARGVNQSAIAHFRAALKSLETFPETDVRRRTELEILMELGPVLMTVEGEGADSARAAYERAVELAQRDFPSATHFLAMFGLWVVNLLTDLAHARNLIERLFDEARQLDNVSFVASSYSAAGNALFWLGDFVLARQHLERAVELSPVPQEQLYLLLADPGMFSRVYLANDLWALGFPDQALAWAENGMAFAQSLGHPNTVAAAMSFAIHVRIWRREVIAVTQQAAQAIAYTEEHGLTFYQLPVACSSGWALAEEGKLDEGICALRDGIEAWKGVGSARGAVWFTAWLSDAYRRAGRLEEGVVAADQAFESIRQTGERQAEAELYRVKGELLLADGQQDQAEECLRKASAVARNQQARSLELRATTSLARLLRDTDRRGEARTMLTEIYGWFTEGFDTADLKDAKRLLEELA
jgi:class 3 adenylate cyclase/tetratricopeptide (TPR) repeat protein